MKYPVIVEPDEEAGGFVAYCPTLKGCVSQGETEEEALENIKDAIALYLETLQAINKAKRMVEVEVPAPA